MTVSSLKQLTAELQQGAVSSVELTQDYLQRIKRSDHNAFISVTEDSALRQAAEADKAIQSGSHSELQGLPIAHKDIFCIDGIKTTCGSKMLDNFVAPYSATIVQNLQDQGVVSLGKTNMDEFAMGSSNENSFYGPVQNPWANTLVPGGSSGGSAAAVAAHLAPAATGSDTGGSIRQPAAFCGLTGVKPSYGRCSRYGMVAFASSLDQAGVLCHNAEDAALLLNAMCGFDPRDATSLEVPEEDFSRQLAQSLDGLKIGLPKEFFGDGLDDEIATLVMDAIEIYQEMGATVKDVSLPHAKLALPAYYVIAPAEASANLSRYDGIRFGHRASKFDDLDELYTRTRSEGFGEEVKRRIMIGTYALSSGYYDAYYARAQKVRRLVSEDFNSVFDDVDVLMGPTTPSTAFALDSRHDDPVTMYLNDIYTIPVSLAGLPAASIQCGLTQQGLPAGLQLITPYLQESKLLNIAHQFQQQTDWHTRVAPSVERSKA